jgi:hypothetical protein
MIEAFFSNPYAVIGALLLASFIGYVTHRTNRKGRTAGAAATFRAAIDLSVLSKLQGHQLHGALIKVFPKHRDAAREFRRYLGPISRLRFHYTWRAYHGGNEEHPNFTQYYIGEDGPELLLQRLEAIKNAANQT